jgi:F1F0 ATPase subunit 2
MSAGFAFGLAYFAALWATVRRLSKARQPALLSVTSLAARLAAAVGFFYLIGAGDWRRFLAAGVGFIGARFIYINWWRRPVERVASDGGLLH